MGEREDGEEADDDHPDPPARHCTGCAVRDNSRNLDKVYQWCDVLRRMSICCVIKR